MIMEIVLDIETIPCSEDTKKLLPEITPPANIKDKDKLDVWRQEILPELKIIQYKETALDPTFGRIFCIGMLYLNSNNVPKTFVSIYSEDENYILSQFWEEMKKVNPGRFITHNGISFDLPFIWKRSVINNIKPPITFNLARYRTDYVYDTMAVWANWDYRQSIKLDTLARALGIQGKSDSALVVYDLWKDRKFHEISNYCLQDVYITYCCYCRMNFIEIISKEKITSRTLTI